MGAVNSNVVGVLRATGRARRRSAWGKRLAPGGVYDRVAPVYALLHLHELWFALVIVVVEVVAIGVSRRVRTMLSAPWKQPPPLPAKPLQPSYRARPEDDEAPTVEDLAFLLGQRDEPAFAVLCGLVHRGIVEVDPPRIRRGEHPLPSDASVLETKLYPPEGGDPILDVLTRATEDRRSFHDGRLRAWGLIVTPWAEHAARFGAGCVLLVPVLLVMARFHAGAATWVTTVLLFALLGVGRLVLRPGRVTARGQTLVDEAQARVEQLELGQWPDEAVDRRTVVVGVAALGTAKTAATRLMDVAVTVLGAAPSDHFLAQIRPGTQVALDDDGLVRRLSPTPPEEFAKARWLLVAAVLAIGGAASAATWLVGERVEAGPQGVRGYVPPSGYVDRREAVPPPERGRDVMHCNLSPEDRAAKREAAAERSVFAKMAEIERRTNPSPVAEPDLSAEREHLAAPGSIYAISSSRLHRIDIDGGRWTIAPPQDLEVRLPYDDTVRLHPLAPALQSITIDRYGALMMVGDGRLYQCSPDSGVCFPRGVLPSDTQAVFARVEPEGQSFVAVDESDRWWTVEMLYPSGYLADALMKAVADVELCLDPISHAEPNPTPTSNPTRGFDGRLYASIYDHDKDATFLGVLDPETGAIRKRLGRLTNGRARASLLAMEGALYVFMPHGAVFRYDAAGRRLHRAHHLHFEVLGVAAYFGPASAPK